MIAFRRGTIPFRHKPGSFPSADLYAIGCLANAFKRSWSGNVFIVANFGNRYDRILPLLRGNSRVPHRRRLANILTLEMARWRLTPSVQAARGSRQKWFLSEVGGGASRVNRTRIGSSFYLSPMEGHLVVQRTIIATLRIRPASHQRLLRRGVCQRVRKLTMIGRKGKPSRSWNSLTSSAFTPKRYEALGFKCTGALRPLTATSQVGLPALYGNVPSVRIRATPLFMGRSKTNRMTEMTRSRS